MRYLVEVPNFGDFAAPEVFAEMARRAEEAGWDALLVWDHVAGENVVFLPTPVQRRRVPVWVGGIWPNKAPMRRAARWDGAIPAMAGVMTWGAPSRSCAGSNKA